MSEGDWELGAKPLGEGGARFMVWAPRARRVHLCAGDGMRASLELRDHGYWVAELPEARPGLEYRYQLDDARPLADPASRFQPHGVEGPSQVVDPTAFAWSDAGWRGVRLEDLVIYELHVGTFSREGSFDGVRARIPALAELGITAIELMPVAEFPGSRNWGYDGVFPYAPQSTYGGPEGLRRLVDAAHACGMAVLLDVVYNHLGPEGNVLPAYGPYFTDCYRTPWGAALNFDQADSDPVRRYFVENACYWINEFHIDGLRLDAVHAIFDSRPQHIVAEIASRVHALGTELGRRIHVFAESDSNDVRLVRPRVLGGYELDGVWNDDFHHAVHAAITGERSGYYVDFGSADAVAKTWNERFVLDGSYSRYRRRRHGAPASEASEQHFVVCIQNHDQVGNRAAGERLSALASPSRLRLAACLLLLSPYVPLLFMGEEYGETRPFLYFVDHRDRGLREAVREGRRREFAAFGWRGEIADPFAHETFERSRLDSEQVHRPPHREVRELYASLLRLRAELPVLRPGTGTKRAWAGPGGWMTAEYRARSGERGAWAVFHLGQEAADVPLPCLEGTFIRRLASDDTRFGGSGPSGPERFTGGTGSTRVLSVPPETALLYEHEVAG